MTTYVFWRDLLERIVRNLLQTIGPIALAVSETGKGPNLEMTAAALFTVAVFTALKGIVGATAPDDADPTLRILDRVGSAMAATVLAFLPSDAVVSWAGWHSVDLRSVALAALGSGVVARLSFYAAPPALGRSTVERVPA